MASTEMVSRHDKQELSTYWQLCENAAKAKYGRNIRIIKTPYYEAKVENIPFELDVSKHGEPREKSRTIIDINMKEYSNGGKEGQDESVVKILKTTSESKDDHFHFATTTGVKFGIDGDIGAKITGQAPTGVLGGMGIKALASVTGRLGANYSKSKTKTEETDTKSHTANMHSYEQEEKICVPAGKCVKAKITTYSMKYEMEYSVKFSIKKHATVPILYRSTLVDLCCGICRRSGSVLVRDMISTLTDYVEEDEDGKTSFTQPGTLSWKGEGCIVDKLEEPL